VLWIQIHFFRIWIHKFYFRFRIRILRLLFWPEIFENGASHCFRMCSVFQLKNVRFFLFHVFGLRFFTKFLFYNSVWIRIQIWTFFGFEFGSRQNIRIISDSDPQHCWRRILFSERPLKTVPFVLWYRYFLRLYVSICAWKSWGVCRKRVGAATRVW
jgi:hypothetical protein